MILVDGEKYACVQCIRGHRSSTCKHSQRPLVQVRSRGRPSLNQTHRIAVTESEIVLSRDQVTIQESPESNNTKDPRVPPQTSRKANASSCCSSNKPQEPIVKSCCSSSSREGCTSSSNGVILLKASKRQFVDVVDGNLDFVGPYKGSSTNSFKIANPKKHRHDRSSSCRSQSLHSKLKALKTLKVNEVKLENQSITTPAGPSSCNPGLPEVTNNQFNHQSLDSDKALNEYHTVSNGHVSKFINTGFPIPDELQKTFQYQFNFQSNDSIQETHTMQQDISHSNQNAASSTYSTGTGPQLFDMFLGEGCADECNCGASCTCPGCLIHRTNEELRDYGILDSSTTASTPTELNIYDESVHRKNNGGIIPRSYDNNIRSSQNNHYKAKREEDSPEIVTPNASAQLLNFETIDELLIKELLDDDCSCEDDACRCYNCLKHEISNGVRLKDGVRVFLVDDLLGNVPSIGDDLSVNDSLRDEDNEEAHDCGCSPEECQCFNCPQHGIYNGVRIKDGAVV